MHRDLAPHLHTDECNKLIVALQKCHKEHPFKKFYGFCNFEDKKMTDCLKREMDDIRAANHKKAKERLKKPRKYTIYDKFDELKS